MKPRHYPRALCSAVSFAPLLMLIAGLLYFLVSLHLVPISESWILLFLVVWAVDYVGWLWHRDTCHHCYSCRGCYPAHPDAHKAAETLHHVLPWLTRIIWAALGVAAVVGILNLVFGLHLEWLHAGLTLVFTEVIAIRLLVWTRHWRWQCPICYPETKQNWSLPPVGEPTDIKH